MMDRFDLNPFEIKAEIENIFQKLNDTKDFEKFEIHYRKLDAQKDKSIIVKLLFREINYQNANQNILKFLLLRYCPHNELVEGLWNIIKNNMNSNRAKIFALDLLRDIDTNWSYEECDRYLTNPDELVNSDTKKILDNALVNPEVQIDFLDFLNSLPEKDQIILLKSLEEDYSKDELANMIAPVFLSMSDTETGKTALDILGRSKSKLAYHALKSSLEFADNNLLPLINKNISILKLSGIREDNAKEFYKNILKDSSPYRFCITYPDGHGSQAVIVSRVNTDGKIKFIAIVLDDYKGIRDCFGFNEISQFECNAIIERFYKGQRAIEVPPGILKSILEKAEKLSGKHLPYEYVCWRTLLEDIDPQNLTLEYTPKQLSKKEFEEILQSDFTDFWFLNSTYSDEFEDFLKILDNCSFQDYEQIIDANLDKIFYKEEYKIWTERILNMSMLKHIAKEEKTAQNLYSLYNDKELTREFLKNIIRKSIYEYYFAKNDKEKVKAIEEMWVKNV